MSSFWATRWQRVVSFPLRRFRRSVAIFFRARATDSRWLYGFVVYSFTRIIRTPAAIVSRISGGYLAHTCKFCRVFMLPLPHDIFSWPLVFVLGRRYSCPHCGCNSSRLDRRMFRWLVKEPPIPIMLDPGEDSEVEIERNAPVS